jgi:hypothetical protein
MPTFCIGSVVKGKAALLLLFLGVCAMAGAQQISFAGLHPEAVKPLPFVKAAEPTTVPETSRHRFWDRKNSFLFAATAALSTADLVATRNNLQNGGRELNPMTRAFGSSTAGLTVNFAGETAAVIGLSYLFHKSGHHKFERAMTILNLGASASAVTFDVIHH